MNAPWFSACLLGVLLVPTAAAGTAQAPEITDPAGDVNSPGLDLRAAWVQVKDNETLTIHIQIEGGFPQQANCANLPGTPVRATFRWALLAMQPVDAQGNVTHVGKGGWISIGPVATCTSAANAPWRYNMQVREDRTSNMVYDERELTGSIQSGVAVIEAPIDVFGLNETNVAGASLTKLYARSFGGTTTTAVTTNTDIAPAQGYGRDFPVGIAAPAGNGTQTEGTDDAAGSPSPSATVGMLVVAASAWAARATRRRRD